MRQIVLRMLVVSTALGALATGCTNLTPAEQRALTGGALGAAAGAAIGAAAGNAGAGAAIGGATGATGGYLYERSQEQDRYR